MSFLHSLISNSKGHLVLHDRVKGSDSQESSPFRNLLDSRLWKSQFLWMWHLLLKFNPKEKMRWTCKGRWRSSDESRGVGESQCGMKAAEWILCPPEWCEKIHRDIRPEGKGNQEDMEKEEVSRNTLGWVTRDCFGPSYVYYLKYAHSHTCASMLTHSSTQPFGI